MYKKLCMFLMVVCGSTKNACSLPGTLDTTFNAGGVQPGTVSTTIDNNLANNQGFSVAMQQDGKIVVAGSATISGVDRFAIARFNADGTLDTTFNASSLTQPGTVTTTIENTAGPCVAQSVAIQQDGKIVVAGYADLGSGNRFAVARFNTDGTLDTTFNPAPAPQPGTVSTTIDNDPTSNTGSSVVIQQDGKIVVAGNAVIGSETRFAVARFNTDGTLDTTFNPAPAPQPGTVSTTVDNSATSVGFSVAMQQDGKIVIAGYAVIGSGVLFGAARFKADGTLDTTFNAGGVQPGTVTTTIDNDPTSNTDLSVAIQQDGKIVVAGSSVIGSENRFAVARFNVNGTLDTTFNASSPTQPGTVTTTIDNNSSSVGVSVAIQQDGKIVEVGYTALGGIVGRFAVARFNTNGTLDTTFNAGGIQPGTVSTTIENAPGTCIAQAVAIQQDGKIVAAGYVEMSGGNRFAVARFLGGTTKKSSIATNNLCALRLIEKYGPRLAARV